MTIPVRTALLSAVRAGIGTVELGHPLFSGMPCSPNHPGFRMVLARRHDDVIRPDGGSAASELLITGGHVGTHIDALAHVSHRGLLHADHAGCPARRGRRPRCRRA